MLCFLEVFLVFSARELEQQAEMIYKMKNSCPPSSQSCAITTVLCYLPYYLAQIEPENPTTHGKVNRKEKQISLHLSPVFAQGHTGK